MTELEGEIEDLETAKSTLQSAVDLLGNSIPSSPQGGKATLVATLEGEQRTLQYPQLGSL